MFSIWGDKTKSNYFTLFGDLLENLINYKSTESCYDLHDNLDKENGLRQMFINAGFRNFRKEYSNVIYSVHNIQELGDLLMTPWVADTIKTFDEGLKTRWEEGIKSINESFKNDDKFVNINVLIISVEK